MGNAATAAAAASIIRRPPLACTLTIQTPSSAAARTAPATVLGISWNFRSRNTSKPSRCNSSTTAGPARVNNSLPTFTRHSAGDSCRARSARQAPKDNPARRLQVSSCCVGGAAKFGEVLLGSIQLLSTSTERRSGTHQNHGRDDHAKRPAKSECDQNPQREAMWTKRIDKQVERHQHLVLQCKQHTHHQHDDDDDGSEEITKLLHRKAQFSETR